MQSQTEISPGCCNIYIASLVQETVFEFLCNGENRLSPDYRFNPTDLELVRYYLRRKFMRSNPIDEVNIYKFLNHKIYPVRP